METHKVCAALVLLGATLTGGCSGIALSCSNPEIKELVLKVVRENHDDGYGFADSPRMRARVNELAEKVYVLSDVVTRKMPTDNDTSMQCKARLEYTSYRVIRDERQPQKDFMTDPSSLIRSGERSTSSTRITYSVVKTDEGKASVEVRFDD